LETEDKGARKRTRKRGGKAEEELAIELPPMQSATTSDAVEEDKPTEPEGIEVEGPSSSELYHCRKHLYVLLLKAGNRGGHSWRTSERVRRQLQPGRREEGPREARKGRSGEEGRR
jgi:hypothetical protein